MESYLRFQLHGITGPVRSAKLRLGVPTNGTVDGPGVHATSGDWSESGRDLVHPARRTAPTAAADAGAIPPKTRSRTT